MLTFAAPDPLCGAGLEEEIEAAGYTNVDVILTGTEIRVTGTRSADGAEIAEADTAVVGAVVAAHTAAPTAAQVAAAQLAQDRARAVELFGRGYNNLTVDEQNEASLLVAKILGG